MSEVVARPGLWVETRGTQTCLYEPLPHQQQFHASTARYCLMEGGRGSGKALHVETPIPTPNGYRRMADLRVGDDVYDERGRPTMIVWKSETHVDPLGTFRVTFDDGSEIVCGGGHEWVTTTQRDRKRAGRATLEARAKRRATRPDRGGRGVRAMPDRPNKVKADSAVLASAPRTTTEIAETLVVYPSGRRHLNHSIQTAEAWQCPERDLPLHPYALGVWLGDGSTHWPNITTNDDEVWQGLSVLGFHMNPYTARYGWGVRGLCGALFNTLRGNKHIPHEYLWASENQRLALLQGLMDTDGYADTRGGAEFCNTNRQLAEGVRQLVHSFGVKTTWVEDRARLNGKDCGPRYRVQWTDASLPAFRLTRKAERIAGRKNRSTQRRRYITAVDRVSDVPLQCIQVEAPSHLYLCGIAGIPTHNSLAMRMDGYMRCLSIPGFRALLVRRSFPELEKSHLMKVPVEAKTLGLPDNAWHSTSHTLRFPNGSLFVFGSVENDNELTKFLSSEWEIVYYDELATFTERQWSFLNSSLRSPIKGYRPVARAGTNPVGVGASWVRRYFIDKNVSAEAVPSYRADQYEAIHSTMFDNPHVDRAEYEEILSALPSEALRDALLHGKWVLEGQFFSEWAETKDGRPWHVVDELPMYRGAPIIYAPHIEIVRVIDWGYSRSGNPGVCLWFALLPDGSAIGFQEFYFREMLPQEVADEIKRRSQDLRVRYTIGDTAMWAEYEGPSIAERFEQCGLGMIEADKNRIGGWVAVHAWLKETRQIVSGDGVVTTVPRLRFLRSGCPETIRTLPQMVVDPKNPQDMVTVGVEDDAADCCRYFCQDRGGPSRETARDPEVSWIRRQMRKDRLRLMRGVSPVLRGV